MKPIEIIIPCVSIIASSSIYIIVTYRQRRNQFTLEILKRYYDGFKKEVHKFNYFEHLSLLILTGKVSERFVKKYMKTAFITNFKKAEKSINEWQKENPYALINFKKLAEKWQNQ